MAQAGRDVVVFLSHSGNTEECVRAAYHLVSKGVCTMVITGGKSEGRLHAVLFPNYCRLVVYFKS